MVTSDQGSHGDSSFELNLVPFIDILSTCICFLLMTTVWIQIGSFNVSQALGDQANEDKNPPSVVVRIGDDGALDLSLKDIEGGASGNAPKEIHLASASSKIDWERLKNYVTNLRVSLPELQTALVMPSENVKYDDVIGVMDTFRDQKIAQIGLAPIGGN